jgi:FixJ family two-component response regulator
MTEPHVLLALADETLHEPYRQLLDVHGFQVEIASGGVDCLLKLCKFAPEVLILDREIHWGGGDGVLAVLRSAKMTLWPPVVLLIGEKDRMLPRMRKPPVVACFRKPVRFDDLLESISECRSKVKESDQVLLPGMAIAKAEQGGGPHFSPVRQTYG